MVKKPHLHEAFNSSSVACIELIKPIKKTDRLAHMPVSTGDFDWNTSTQSVILGSFFYGYVLTQLPGGNISEKYGAKWLFGIGVLITSVFTIITPFAAWWGVYPLIIVRIIEGLGEGVTFPAMSALLGRWAPKNERSLITAVTGSGAAIGSVRSATPWKSIFSSRYVWALTVTHFGLSWGFYTFLTELPTYLARILHFDIRRNGALSALPHLVGASFSIVASIFADKLRATERYKINTIRKSFNSIGCFVPAFCVGFGQGFSPTSGFY
ncbi:hypothetical protein TNIN_189071 [Trichonephila inaurata madagascariensis]|uniref:Major facilitator superfamily (MFS) profile domain-containing protein n=1 Tax=Trichonephila inaurata madagascariensis TaxID=2747483 RepID=A0A8X6Y5A7_9ARAC|nr:hypothetical protein TNIN_189071 [Trichonephila inaurata madagascariensis]